MQLVLQASPRSYLIIFHPSQLQLKCQDVPGHLSGQSKYVKILIVLHYLSLPSTQASCLQDLPDHKEAVAKVLPGLRQEIWGDDQTDPGDRFVVSGSNLNNGASP